MGFERLEYGTIWNDPLPTELDPDLRGAGVDPERLRWFDPKSVRVDEEREEQQIVKFDDLQQTSTVIERTQGHYEVQETPYGQAFVWCPECVVVECDCGERPVLSASQSTCRCGADHADLIREELASKRSSEEVSHPLEDEYSEWCKKQEEFLHTESHYWLEWRFMD